MATTQSKREAPNVYPTWDAFVQDKLNRANALLATMKPEALRRLMARNIVVRKHKIIRRLVAARLGSR